MHSPHRDLIKLANTSTKKEVYVNSNTKEKVQLYIKMNILQTSEKEITMLNFFEHMGELKLFNHIILDMRSTGKNQYYHNAQSMIDIEKQLELKKSTQHKYIKLMVAKDLLIKIQNGIYKINPKHLQL